MNKERRKQARQYADEMLKKQPKNIRFGFEGVLLWVEWFDYKFFGR